MTQEPRQAFHRDDRPDLDEPPSFHPLVADLIARAIRAHHDRDKSEAAAAVAALLGKGNRLTNAA